MDATDYRIYRYLSRDGEVRFWASRRVFDPRVTAREIADRVGLSEAGVRLRVQQLKSRRLLGGSEVGVNPALFGASVVVAEVPVTRPQESERLLRDLAVVEGVLFARDLLDEQSRKVDVYYVSDTPPATARRTALLQRLAPGGSVRGPVPYWLPPCERSLSPLDWRLVLAFRRNPDGTLARFASASHVSRKTAALRYGALLDAAACWWSHASDAEEWPFALLRVALAPGVERARIARDVARVNDLWIPVADDGLGVAPTSVAAPLAGLVPVDRPAALERAVRATLAVEGVSDVRRTFGLGSASYPAWTDEQLAHRVPRPG